MGIKKTKMNAVNGGFEVKHQIKSLGSIREFGLILNPPIQLILLLLYLSNTLGY
jgi:hypothetical protein